MIIIIIISLSFVKKKNKLFFCIDYIYINNNKK